MDRLLFIDFTHVTRIYCLLLGLAFLAITNQANAQINVKLNFSQERGFSDTAFDLVITSTEAAATIRYTLDGEEPSPSSGLIYNGSLTIDTTTVLRAIGYIQDVDTSKVYTHTYLFLDNVLEQSYSIPGWPNGTYDIGSGNATAVHDYEMDPAIVNSTDYSADLIKGLKDIPSMSIVMPKDDFWDMYDGNTEKKTSIELLYHDDPDENEQEDCGIEPHSHDRLKRSMRLSFKSIYGAGMWDSDIFRNAVIGAETAENEFDRIVLRAGNNRAWSRNWNPDRTAFTRDEWFRQSQIAASGIGSHGTFVHLYVNGLYWGLYNPIERPDEAFSASYLGGDKEDYYAVSHGGDQGGDDTRYDYMMNTLVYTDLTQSTNYDELKSYLDIDQFSDYLLVSWMTGVQDWPNNNWWGGNRNTPAGPFMYYGWDNEWSWDVTANANNGAWVHPKFRSNDTGGNASDRVFNKAKVNDDFMMSFSDRAYKLCYNDGPMTDANSRLRWSTLNDNIEDAVVAESARWGDGINDGVTRTRNVHWQDEVDRLDGLMDGNVDRLITALRDEDYYPSIDPPLYINSNDTIVVSEIAVAAGYEIDLVNPNANGIIYYTTDGADPRSSGGAIGASAVQYTGQELIINSSSNLLARVKFGNEWSALHCLNVIVTADLSWIKLTEIMYNPEDFGMVDGGELEFLEIKNTNTTLTLDISGLQIVDGVEYTFPVGTSMAPQSFLVIASNAAELTAKCPGITVLGEYSGALSNGGEQIEFVSYVGDTIIRVEYDDKSPWPTEADGDGYSLVSSIANPVGDQDGEMMWKLSADNTCGSPGADDVYCADADADTVCDNDDLCPGFDDRLIGTACDDGDACTVDDEYTTNCLCEGTFLDTDEDGICDADEDCNGSSVGDPCDDGDDCTVGDVYDGFCNCVGTFADADEDGICDADDTCDNNLIGTACDDGDDTTINDVYDANCICMGTSIVSYGPYMEAEEATVGSEWSVISDAEACSGAYALPPNLTSTASAPNTPEDRIRFTFNIDVAGTYKVYAKTMTTSGSDDSFWVRANDGNWNRWNRINVGNYGAEYQWSQVGNWSSGDPVAAPVTFELVAGVNTVDFAYREPGARLDKIFVTDEDLTALNLVETAAPSVDLSFKYIVEEACPNDTIRFDAVTDATPIIVDDQLIIIDKNLTIIGNGTTQTMLSGNNLYQLFSNNAASLSIHHLKMQNGYAPTDGGAFINNGMLILNNVELEGNKEGATPKVFTNNGTVTVYENGSVIVKE